ncbi:MAG TPA: MFS transporter [Fimbriimonadaceae bacterium]|nr:MFS transporter [Fimbriimonadaceae bacterium]
MNLEAEPSGSPTLTVTSPYEGKRIRFWEHIKLSSYWFGSNFVWGCFLGPVLSSEMAKIAPETAAGDLGLLYFFGAIPALLVPLIFGPLSDRCQHPKGRRKPYVAGGAVIALIGLVLMALGFQALNLFAYIGGYLVLQVGSNIALAAYSGVIPDLIPPEQRGVASGYMAVMSQLATLIGALASGILLGKDQHLLVYLLIGVVFAIFVLITVFGIRENPLIGDLPKFNFKAYLKSLWIDPKKYSDFAWVWITRALMMFGFYAIQPFILYYLRDVIHVKNPAQSSGIVLGLILLGAAVSGYLGGHISDKRGRKPVVVISSYIISVAAILLIFATNLEIALVIGVIFGLGYGAYISVDWALGADVLPSKADAGKDMAVWHVAMTLPQQIAPLVAGSVLQAFVSGYVLDDDKKVSTYALNGYATIFILASFCFLLGGILLKNVRGVR